MRIDPFAPRLLIDYDYFCNRFGPLPFSDFVALWHAADALMQAALEFGYGPHEVPELLITAKDARMEFIRSAVEGIRQDVGRMRPRRARIRRWRSFKPARRSCLADGRMKRGDAERRTRYTRSFNASAVLQERITRLRDAFTVLQAIAFLNSL